MIPCLSYLAVSVQWSRVLPRAILGTVHVLCAGECWRESAACTRRREGLRVPLCVRARVCACVCVCAHACMCVRVRARTHQR